MRWWTPNLFLEIVLISTKNIFWSLAWATYFSCRKTLASRRPGYNSAVACSPESKPLNSLIHKFRLQSHKHSGLSNKDAMLLGYRTFLTSSVSPDFHNTGVLIYTWKQGTFQKLKNFPNILQPIRWQSQLQGCHFLSASSACCPPVSTMFSFAYLLQFVFSIWPPCIYPSMPSFSGL